MPPSRKTTDVLVVGAGAGGLAAAVSAARNGASVLVVERRSEGSDLPRATALSIRSMEILRTWGLADRVRAAGGNVPTTAAVAETMAALAREEGPLWAPPNVDPAVLSPESPVCVPQDYLEPILAEHLRSLGGEISFGTEVADLSSSRGGITATVVDRATGRTGTIGARYGVGADGARSTVRRSLGIGSRELGELGHVLQATFRADLARVGGPRHALYFLDHPQPDTVMAAAGPGRWVCMWPWRPAGEDLQDWTPARLTEHLRAATGVPDLDVEIQALMPVILAAEAADTVRAGRVFLVGDAAHRTTPVGGVGMNTAIHDGHNLGWKLAWVCRGWAGPDLLDSYAAERELIGVRNARRSLVPNSRPEVDDFTADLGNRYHPTVVPGVPGAGLDFAARPGERAPHGWVRRAGRRVSTLDLFADRLTLLTGRLGDAWRDAARRLPDGPPLALFGPDTGLDDPDGVLDAGYGLSEGAAVLVRPDGFVAWRGDGRTDPVTALAAAVSATLGFRVVKSVRTCA